MKFIDLFAGAGGLSEGFIRAGFEPVAHVEMDHYASLTLKTRAAYFHLKKNGRTEIYRDYIKGNITREELYTHIPEDLSNAIINAEISDETIDEIFSAIDKNLKNFEDDKVDVIIGGPPCQAYSLVGRARDPYGKERDPRNYLYKQYVKFLEKYKPDMFVFENVPGILNAAKGTLFNDVKAIMRESGYEIEANTLNACDFGVLQQRKRVIIIGWSKEKPYCYPELEKVIHNYVVNDLLMDLPKLKPGGEASKYKTEPSQYLLDFKLREQDDELIQHITRMHNERDRKIYKTAIKLWNEKKKRLVYSDLPEELRTHNNLSSFLDRFKVVSGDLPYSHTVVAHIAKDGHYYIHPDNKQIRSLSVREAARIQSFPDNFFFEGPRTAVFTQIGNAVPPLMAEKIAVKIEQILNEEITMQLSF